MSTSNPNRWWTVVGGAICLSVGAGVISAFMFGTFIKAIAAENGWGRSQVSLGLTIFEFAMGPGTIALGSLDLMAGATSTFRLANPNIVGSGVNDEVLLFGFYE